MRRPRPKLREFWITVYETQPDALYTHASESIARGAAKANAKYPEWGNSQVIHVREVRATRRARKGAK